MAKRRMPAAGDDAYREAACRICALIDSEEPYTTVSRVATVSHAGGGAFVEVQAWIPDAEAEKEEV